MELEQHLETTVKAHDQMLHRRVDLLLRTGKVLKGLSGKFCGYEPDYAEHEAYGCLFGHSRRKTSHQCKFYHANGQCK